jgi:hypothetical protein
MGGSIGSVAMRVSWVYGKGARELWRVTCDGCSLMEEGAVLDPLLPLLPGSYLQTTARHPGSGKISSHQHLQCTNKN